MVFPTIMLLTLFGILIFWLWFAMFMAFMPLWFIVEPLRYFWDGIKGIIDTVR